MTNTGSFNISDQRQQLQEESLGTNQLQTGSMVSSIHNAAANQNSQRDNSAPPTSQSKYVDKVTEQLKE